MPELFGVDIAGIVNDTVGSGLLPATLHHVTQGERGSDVTAGRSQSITDYQTTGVIGSYNERFVDGSNIRSGDRRITLMGEPLPVEPQPGDRVNIEELTFTVVSVRQDASRATFVIQGRR